MKRAESTDDYVKAGDRAWGIAAGSAASGVGYSSSETGGNQAHNNMPPYIQVSVWRRTA
jgi:microcystin-dependent protein